MPKLEIVLHKKGVETPFYDAEIKFVEDRVGSIIGRYVHFHDGYRFETISRPQILKSVHLDLIQAKLLELNE